MWPIWMDVNPLLTELFEKQKHCDVTFVFHDSEGKPSTIGAHKAILSTVSDKFESTFFGECVQDHKEIEVPDIGRDVFKLLLR